MWLTHKKPYSTESFGDHTFGDQEPSWVFLKNTAQGYLPHFCEPRWSSWVEIQLIATTIWVRQFAPKIANELESRLSAKLDIHWSGAQNATFWEKSQQVKQQLRSSSSSEELSANIVWFIQKFGVNWAPKQLKKSCSYCTMFDWVTRILLILYSIMKDIVCKDVFLDRSIYMQAGS